MDSLARYMWSALSTSTHRTGTLSIGRTSTMNRDTEQGGASDCSTFLVQQRFSLQREYLVSCSEGQRVDDAG